MASYTYGFPIPAGLIDDPARPPIVWQNVHSTPASNHASTQAGAIGYRSAGDPTYLYIGGNPATLDFSVRLTAVYAGQSIAGPAACVSVGNNCYFLEVAVSGGIAYWRVYLRAAGVDTRLGNQENDGSSVAANDIVVLRATIVGGNTQLRAYKNPNVSFSTGLMADRTDATFTNQTVGLAGRSNWVNYVDDWIAADTVAGGPFPHYTRRTLTGGMVAL